MGDCYRYQICSPVEYFVYGRIWRSDNKESEYKPYLLWRYIDKIFFLQEHDRYKLKSFVDKINEVHST